MKKLKIEFILLHDKEKFLFWTCILDSDVESIDEHYLNNDNEYKLKEFSTYQLKMEIVSITEEELTNNTKSYKRRPPVFLAKDETFERGSPYKYSCSELINYYSNDDFYNKFITFCPDLSDSNINKIQFAIIKKIKEILGIDILKQESIPGCISYYKKLDCFTICGQYNPGNGQRYIQIIPNENSNISYLLEIEILDEKKILHKSIMEFHNVYTYNFPSIEKLEPFSQIHITIYSSLNNEYVRQYEETQHLVRRVNFGMNVSGGNSKLRQNRFLNKKTEVVSITEHMETFSTNNETDWTDLENNYKDLLYGKEAKYLKSCFYHNTPQGRSEFHSWISSVLNSAKEIYIIDPFFDIAGLKDFDSCCNNNNLRIHILTTDPKKTKRESSKTTKDIKNENKENLQIHKIIYSLFPNSSVYFVDRDILHDRFLIIDNGNETQYYLFSNSWNGTVNNYPLFIQEINLITSLNVKDFYSKYFSNLYLQDKNNTIIKKKTLTKKKERITKKQTIKILKKIKSPEYKYNNELFINDFIYLFKSSYYGKSDEYEIIDLCIEILKQKRCDMDLILNIINILLKNQREQLIKNERIIQNKSLSEYKTTESCIERIQNRSFWGGNPSYDLKLDFAYYKLLECCFALFPKEVIDILCELEKKICIYPINNEEKNYFVSELIISYLLCENYLYLNDKNIKSQISFANRTENKYCKIFILNWILDKSKLINISELDDILNEIKLSNTEKVIILSSYYTNISFIRDTDNCINEYLLKFRKYVIEKFSNDNQLLIIFSVRSFLFTHEIKMFELLDFIENVPQVENDIKKIVLLYSLTPVPSKKLFSYVQKLIDDDKYNDYIPIKKQDNESSIIDVNKFINYLPWVGDILADLVQTTDPDNKNLIFKFDIHKDLIFELSSFKKNLDFDYYLLLIILYAIKKLQKNHYIKGNQLSAISWYVPLLLNKYPNDYYGLSFMVLDVYLSLLSKKERIELLQEINSIELKVYILSTISNLEENQLIFFEYIKNYEIEPYAKNKSITYLLFIFLNLLFRNKYKENDSIIRILENIEGILSQLKNKAIDEILSTGILYFKNPDNVNKTKILTTMQKFYHPCVLENLEGLNNE